MKILHTADWHLGRTFKGYPLLNEQRYVLEQIVELIRLHKPDVLLIAGDVYDRSVPPAEAVALFNEIIAEIVLNQETSIIAIAGNHDSAERLNYAQGILGRQNFHIFGSFQLPVPKVVLADIFGKVHFYCVPYIEPEQMRQLVPDQTFKTHQEVMQYIVDEITAQHPEGERAVFVGHSFIIGGEVSESERQIVSVGGSECIAAELFAPFHYTALGHLHARQSFLNGKVRYSGSVFKYSFSEVLHEKSVTLLNMDGNGDCKFEFLPLIPQNDVLRVKGRIIENKFVLSDENKVQPKDSDFLEVLLENDEIVLNAMQIVQKKFPNTLSLPINRTYFSQKSTPALETFQQITEIELFRDFYKKINGKELDPDKESFLKEAIKQAKADEE
jgi:exonuclease SbcD